MPPDIYMPRYADGRWGSYPLISHGTLDNPVAFAQNMGVNTYRGTQLNSDFALEQKLDFITEGLSAKVQYYYDNVIYSRNYIYDYSNGMIIKSGQALNKYVDIWAYTGDPNQPQSEYIFNYPNVPTGTSQFDWVNPIPSLSLETVLDNITTRRMQYQFQLNYARKFGVHNVGALGAMKRQEFAQGSMFKNYREDWVFRATYDYDTKYLIEMNGAYNGSEQFGPGYRFEFFPSLALGYVISNEKFFPLDWINRLKLRYSVGMVGDDNVSGRWLYADAYAYGGNARLNTQDTGLSPYTQYNQSSIGNPDIHWEKALKNNYGVEMGILNDMIMINYDYFTEDRTDILLAGSLRSVPSHFGGSVPPANLGHVKSNGHELEVKFDKRSGMGLHYWAAVAITHTKNEIIFKDDPELLWDYRKAAGHTINQRFIQIRADRYQTWDDIYASVPAETNDLGKMPGFWNMLDFNADGIIKSDDSAPYQYSDIPQNTFNYTIGADYKGFSAMLQLYGVTNVSRYQSLSNFSNRLNVWFVHMRDYWSKDNPDGESYMPKWRSSGAQLGDYWLFDGSYWRIKTAEIAYTLPQTVVQKLGVGNLRIYLNGNNLYFWSRMLDDREGSFLGGGDSEGAYPSVKRVNLGVEVTF
jgi:TonB-linked SusC/RagA family outer membrane protein